MRRLARDTPGRRLAKVAGRLIQERKKPSLAGFWVCIGDFIGGTANDPACTSPSSPAYENGWTYAGAPYDFPAFRHGLDGRLEIKGTFDSSGAADGTVAFTLPSEWRPTDQDGNPTDESLVLLVWDGASLIPFRADIDATTGEVTLTEIQTGGSGGSSSTAIDLRNPSANAYFVATAFTNFVLGRWLMIKDVDSSIYGAVRVPATFTQIAVNLMLGGGTGNTRMQVKTRSIGDGDTIDSTITAESAQTIALTSGLLEVARFPASGGIGSSPAAGDLLVVQIIHVGTDGADTLATDTALYGAFLEVT